MISFIGSMVQASKLDVNLYEEVAVDSDSLNQSIFVIILSSLAAGIGCIRTGGVVLLVFGTIISLISWLLWAYLTFIIALNYFIQKSPELIGEMYQEQQGLRALQD